MFKKFLIISLLIPAYSFSLDPEELMLTQQREQRLINTINARYSDRNAHCVLGACSGGFGRSLLAALNRNSIRLDMVPVEVLVLCLASVSYAGYNLAKVVAIQYRIDRDSRALSQTQADLHHQIVSGMSSLPLGERQSSNDISR